MCSHEKLGGGSDGQVPLELLEREICRLAAQIHSQTCRWLELVAEYDEREGWAQWGARSCAHWVAANCAIAPGAAREQVRVARRLRELPLVREAFAAGQLSYSKVRALTRVENLQRERDMLELARHATAAQLERLVRSYRSVVVAEAAARGGRPERWVAWTHDDDGSILLRARLPAEEGAAVIRAIEAGVEHAYQEERRVSAETSGAPAEEDEGVSAETSDAPAEDGEGVSAETPESPAHGLGNVSAETPERAADGFYAPSAEAAAGDAHRNIDDVSAETPERAADGFYAPLSAVPADDERHLSDDTCAQTLERTAGERRADALLALAETYLAIGPAARSGGDRHQVVVHVAAPTLANQDASGRCELDDGAPLTADTARRLACDGAIVRILERDGTAIDVGRKTRAIPPALQRALKARDGGCRFPGCTATRYVDAHHIVHWADGGQTKLGNLVQLCRHHHRLIHEGGYTVTPTPHGHQFHRPDGRLIPANQQLPPAPPPRHQANIDHRSCRSLSLGDRLDLDLGVQALLTFAPLATAEEAPGI